MNELPPVGIVRADEELLAELALRADGAPSAAASGGAAAPLPPLVAPIAAGPPAPGGPAGGGAGDAGGSSSSSSSSSSKSDSSSSGPRRHVGPRLILRTRSLSLSFSVFSLFFCLSLAGRRAKRALDRPAGERSEL